MVKPTCLVACPCADYDADRRQSTRPYDRFWGRRKLGEPGSPVPAGQPA
ncbi:hypothetical protein ACH30F_00015 [Enterobacter hormaechei subsp. steigerwaltii]